MLILAYSAPNSNGGALLLHVSFQPSPSTSSKLSQTQEYYLHRPAYILKYTTRKLFTYQPDEVDDYLSRLVEHLGLQRGPLLGCEVDRTRTSVVYQTTNPSNRTMECPGGACLVLACPSFHPRTFLTFSLQRIYCSAFPRTNVYQYKCNNCLMSSAIMFLHAFDSYAKGSLVAAIPSTVIIFTQPKFSLRFVLIWRAGLSQVSHQLRIT